MSRKSKFLNRHNYKIMLIYQCTTLVILKKQMIFLGGDLYERKDTGNSNYFDYRTGDTDYYVYDIFDKRQIQKWGKSQ